MSSESSAHAALYVVELATRQWHLIDGVVDNEVNTRAEEGEEEFADVGLSVRQAGWDQVMVGPDIWPPADEIVPVSLTLGQWGLVVSSLEIWAAIAEDGHEGVVTASLIRDTVSARAGEQLPKWPLQE